jgi:predicted secreted protein
VSVTDLDLRGRHAPIVLLALVGAVTSGACGCASAPERAVNGPEPHVEAAPAIGSSAVEPKLPAPDERPTVYAGEETPRIQARRGERFVVALAANITTPYKWELDVSAAPGLTQVVDSTYHETPPEGCEGCVGYGGTRSFTLRALAPGTGTLLFSYRGIGEQEAPAARELAIQLTVE